MMQVDIDDSSRDGDDELAILQIKPPQTSSEIHSVINQKNEKKKKHSKESNRRHNHHHHRHHHHQKYNQLKTNADFSDRNLTMDSKPSHYKDNTAKDLNSEHEKNIVDEDMNMTHTKPKMLTKDVINSDREKNVKCVKKIKLVKEIKESRKCSYRSEGKHTHFLEKMKQEWRNKRLQWLEHQKNKDPRLCTEEKDDLQDNYCEKEASDHSEDTDARDSRSEKKITEHLKFENGKYSTLVSLVSSSEESMDYDDNARNEELSDKRTENICSQEDTVEISGPNNDKNARNKKTEESLKTGSTNENEKVGSVKDNPLVETTKETTILTKNENLNTKRDQENEMPSVSGENCSLEETTKVHAPKLPVYCPAIQGCRSIDGFHVLNRIEEGTYGVVYRARDKETKEIVALKRLKMEREKEGFPITSLREINTLLKAQHPNIVTVREIVVGSNMDRIYIVMDYVEHDLKSLMKTMPRPFSIGEVKTLLMQLLCAVAHLHDNWILHRDLKTSNLLLSHQGILKVGDFGLAREYGSPLKSYTPVVVTLWYRAPELLLGAKKYSTSIDMWSVGCIFGELLTKNALFQGKSESDQINRIFKDLGTPSEKIWPGYNELPLVQSLNITQYPYNNLKSRFSHTFTDIGFDLLNKFLTYNPARRISAEKAKNHEFFNEKPSPVPPNMFPTWPAKSEREYRTARSSPKPPLGGINYSRY